MIRKKYISPSMETVDVNMQHKLLFGSDIDSISADGLFEDEQENFQDEDPESIWNEAW